VKSAIRQLTDKSAPDLKKRVITKVFSLFVFGEVCNPSADGQIRSGPQKKSDYESFRSFCFW
jgi:hypothetical protein